MTKVYNVLYLKKRRKELRNNSTHAEWLLWAQLSNKKLFGYKFRRQYSIKNYVVDFYCPKLKLAIEVDGDSHCVTEQMEYDKKRQKDIESWGIKVIRFTNIDIYENLNEVIEIISKETSP